MMSDWARIADASEIIDGEPFASEWQDEPIALYRHEGTIFAIGDICTHEHVRLSDGWFEGDRIECPLHQSCFEIRTGDRTSVVSGKRVSVRVDHGGRRIIKKKTK